MRRFLFLAFLLLAATARAELLDGVNVIVNESIITYDEVQRPLESMARTIANSYPDNLRAFNEAMASNRVEPLRAEIRNCRVAIKSAANGLRQFLVTLDGGRIGIGAMAVGIAQAAFDRALRYSKERKQFGKTLSEFQITQFKLADMAMKIELARNMVHKAAWLKDQGRPFSKEASMCKLYASEIAMEVASEAIQIHGGYGYMKEYEVERYMRDAKLLEIGEGTSEIQRMVIARLIGC